MNPELDVPIPGSWIRHLSDAEYRELVRPLLDPSKVARPWVEMALVHPSYLRTVSASASERDRALALLRALEQAGAATVDLALARIAVLDLGMPTPADANRAVRLARKPDPSIAIAERYGLRQHAVYGRNAEAQFSNPDALKRWLRTVGNAFLGACGVYAFQNAYSLIRESVDLSAMSGSPIDSYKTALQEVVQGQRHTRPSYSLVEASGPDPARRFRVAVSVGSFQAEGEGASMRSAEEAAARQLFERLMPPAADPAAVRKSPRSGSTFQFIDLPADSRRSIEDLSVRLGLSDSAPALARAFLHASYLRENHIRPEDGNSTLAFLGSAVLGVWSARLQLRALTAIDGADPPEPVTITPWDADVCAAAANALGLRRYLLVGRGHREPVQGILVEAFQAMLGVLLKEVAEPEAVGDRVSPAVSILRTAFEVGCLDAKTRLEQRLTPSGMGVAYHHEETGPHHKREFRADVTLTSLPLRKTLRVKAPGWQTSKRAADKATAGVVLRALDADPPTPADARELEDAPRVQRFVAWHECSVVPSGRSEAIAWFRRGALGTSFLKADRVGAFLAWAQLLDGCDGADGEQLDWFYRACGDAAPSANRLVVAAAARRLIDWVNGLGVDREDERAVETSEFGELLNLAALTRLSATPSLLLDLSDEVESFALLRRTHRSDVAVGSIPESKILGAQGALTLALDRVVARAWNDLPVPMLRLDGSTNQGSATILISAAEAPEPVGDLTQEDTLFAFLCSMLGILDTRNSLSGVEVTIRTIADEDRRGSRLVRAFRSPSEHADPELSETARLVHDLKNEIVAYAASQRQSSSGPMDTTPKIALQYDAARHLDSARAVTSQLSVLASAFSMPLLEEFDFVLFLREYLSQKIMLLPASVRLVTPIASNSSLQLTISQGYLRSILDNLIKNSIEAMPKGGELRLEWTFVEEERTMILEVSDTGEGLDELQVAAFRRRAPLTSTKQGGSGLGLATVRGMVYRMGGDIDVTSTRGTGTTWTLVLPDSSGPPAS